MSSARSIFRPAPSHSLLNTMRHAAVSLALVGAFACPSAVSAAEGVSIPAFERVQLDNGTVLLLMERHDVPLVAFDARVRGGAMMDPPNRYGTASLLANLLEKGADERDALTFAQTVASVGGVIQASAATDSISISGSFMARDRELMVELLADMLQRPKLDAAELQSLRARRIEFIRAAKDSNLNALTPIYGAAELLADHPYGNPVVGSEDTLEEIGPADIRRFYESQVGADRLIVSIAGDFDSTEMKRSVAAAFSPWRKAGASLPKIATPPEASGRRVLLVDAPESVQSYFWIGNVGVARSDPRRAAIDVVNTLFGGRFTSMLNSELRIRTGLSYGAGSRFDRMQQPGPWEMTSFTRTETTIDAIDLAFSTLDKLHQGALNASMLESSKKYVLGQFPLSFETASQWASQLATLEFYELGPAYIEGYADALQAVGLDDTRRVTREVFPTSDDVVLVVIGQADTLREGLKKYGPIEEMELEEGRFSKE